MGLEDEFSGNKNLRLGDRFSLLSLEKPFHGYYLHSYHGGLLLPLQANCSLPGELPALTNIAFATRFAEGSLQPAYYRITKPTPFETMYLGALSSELSAMARIELVAQLEAEVHERTLDCLHAAGRYEEADALTGEPHDTSLVAAVQRFALNIGSKLNPFHKRQMKTLVEFATASEAMWTFVAGRLSEQADYLRGVAARGSADGVFSEDMQRLGSFYGSLATPAHYLAGKSNLFAKLLVEYQGGEFSNTMATAFKRSLVDRLATPEVYCLSYGEMK